MCSGRCRRHLDKKQHRRFRKHIQNKLSHAQHSPDVHHNFYTFHSYTSTATHKHNCESRKKNNYTFIANDSERNLSIVNDYDNGEPLCGVWAPEELLLISNALHFLHTFIKLVISVHSY